MTPARCDAATERLSEEFSSVVNQTEHLLKTFAQVPAEKLGALAANAELGLKAAAERLAQIRDDLQTRAGATSRATDRYVRSDPWRAVGIVAAATAITGLVAGLWIARR